MVSENQDLEWLVRVRVRVRVNFPKYIVPRNIFLIFFTQTIALPSNMNSRERERERDKDNEDFTFLTETEISYSDF